MVAFPSALAVTQNRPAPEFIELNDLLTILSVVFLVIPGAYYAAVLAYRTCRMVPGPLSNTMRTGQSTARSVRTQWRDLASDPRLYAVLLALHACVLVLSYHWTYDNEGILDTLTQGAGVLVSELILLDGAMYFALGLIRSERRSLPVARARSGRIVVAIALVVVGLAVADSLLALDANVPQLKVALWLAMNAIAVWVYSGLYRQVSSPNPTWTMVRATGGSLALAAASIGLDYLTSLAMNGHFESGYAF